jgi:putative effector of murein hydrolase LrgA (UPF0299 family)
MDWLQFLSGVVLGIVITVLVFAWIFDYIDWKDKKNET